MKHIKLFKKKLETNIELDLDENLLWWKPCRWSDDFFINNSSGSDSNASNIPIKFDIILQKKNNTEEYLVGILLRIILYHQFLKK
jgi:hypothetical protein